MENFTVFSFRVMQNLYSILVRIILIFAQICSDYGKLLESSLLEIALGEGYSLIAMRLIVRDDVLYFPRFLSFQESWQTSSPKSYSKWSE